MDNINLDTFEKRYNFDVSKLIEKKEIKGKRQDGTDYSFTLNYISWAYAQKLAKTFDPNFKWSPVKSENGSLVHSGMVLIEMTFLDITEQHYFPILDAKNKAIANPNAFDVNTAQMRGMTKLFSMMSGFGLSLYTGEDIKNLDHAGENNNETLTQKKDNKANGGKKEGFNRDETIAWLNEKYETDEELKAYLKAKLKYFKKSSLQFLKKEELEEIIAELKEKKELNKTKYMVDFINSNKEKHADLVNKVLQEKEAPFVDMLEKPELEELYRLIKGAEAS